MKANFPESRQSISSTAPCADLTSSLRGAGNVAHPVSDGVDVGHDDGQGRGRAEAGGRGADEHAVEHLPLDERVAEVSLHQHTHTHTC